MENMGAILRSKSQRSRSQRTKMWKSFHSHLAENVSIYIKAKWPGPLYKNRL